jgi:hypothetical protein
VLSSPWQNKYPNDLAKFFAGFGHHLRRLLAELSQAFALKHHTPTHPHLVDRTEADHSRELRTHRD